MQYLVYNDNCKIIFIINYEKLSSNKVFTWRSAQSYSFQQNKIYL